MGVFGLNGFDESRESRLVGLVCDFSELDSDGVKV